MNYKNDLQTILEKLEDLQDELSTLVDASYNDSVSAKDPEERELSFDLYSAMEECQDMLTDVNAIVTKYHGYYE